jgi:hypothetical protein
LILVPIGGHGAERFKIAGGGQFGHHEAVHQIDVGGGAGAEIERDALIIALPRQLDGVDGIAAAATSDRAATVVRKLLLSIDSSSEALAASAGGPCAPDLPRTPDKVNTSDATLQF